MPDPIVAPQIAYKHPDESLFYEMDFSSVLAVGETIVSFPNSTPISDSPLTFGSPSVDGSKMKFKVSGGVDGTDYRITGEIFTTEGQTWACVGVMKVRA
ncbi:MAG: hypothetical protein KGL39_17120 [Patescibacteria group bacterium]|nr:hypothetical protein [Patescibacteria group bacterium]